MRVPGFFLPFALLLSSTQRWAQQLNASRRCSPLVQPRPATGLYPTCGTARDYFYYISAENDGIAYVSHSHPTICCLSELEHQPRVFRVSVRLR
jgi:hypothetical protein